MSKNRPKQVKFGEVYDALRQPLDYVLRLEEGHQVVGTLLGVGYYASPLVLLRMHGHPVSLNGHKGLIEKLRPIPIGVTVQIKLVRKKSPYVYEVDRI